MWSGRSRQVGLDPVVLDDLSSGHADFVPGDVPFVRGSVLDGALLLQAFDEHDVTGVVHLAGYKYAGESVKHPLHAYDQNVTGTARLLAVMDSVGVRRMVFSSSAAVYGTPDPGLVTEDSPKRPESPYGETKLIGEWLLADQSRAVELGYTALALLQRDRLGRGPELWDSSPHNLLPIVFRTLLEGGTPASTATTTTPRTARPSATTWMCRTSPMRTAVAAQRLEAGATLEPAYNLGSGDGLIRGRDHAQRGRGDRDRVRPGGRSAQDRRPRQHRRVGAARHPRSGLGHAPQPHRDGRRAMESNTPSCATSQSRLNHL